MLIPTSTISHEAKSRRDDYSSSQSPISQYTKKRKVLIVDNEPDILVICTKALSKKFLVHSFSNPAEAFEHFNKNSSDYDLVLTDVRMPIMSGFKLAKQIRNIRPDIPILFMTAFDTVDLEYKDVFPSSDSKQFISKPVSMVKLEQLIFSYIKKVG